MDHKENYYEKVFTGQVWPFEKSDPEFIEIFKTFACDQVLKESKLDDKTRFTVILAALLGCQGMEAFKYLLPAALDVGLTPIEVKEILYQSVAYIGLAKAFPFFEIINDCLKKRGIKLPLKSQKTVTQEQRQPKGTEIQVKIFGEGMKDFYKSGKEDRKHINYFLASNCFGDYYTRDGLDLKTRELITFCFLIAQGGCELQATSHAAGNLAVGNDKDFLIDVITQLVPYIGYPRTLNALTCLDNAVESNQ